jgi:hypothetical protein
MRRGLSSALGFWFGACLVVRPVGAADSRNPAGADTRPTGVAGADTRRTGIAGADTPAELVPTQRATRKSFYGWQILVTGGVGGLLAAGAIFLPDRPLGSLPATATFMVAMPVYALGGPIAHWTHGDFTRGLVSFGGNVAFPLVGGFVGQAIRCRPSDAPVDCGGLGFFTGFGIGLLTAPIVDAIALGWEDMPIDYIGALEHRSVGQRSIPHPPLGTSQGPRGVPRVVGSRVSIAPAWTFGPHGSFELGLSGRF